MTAAADQLPGRGLREERPISTDGADTPQKLFVQRVRQWGDGAALRVKRRGIWQTITWREYGANAQASAAALRALGVRRGEVVAVLAENRPEWLFMDLGAQCAGIIGCGIYPTSSPEQVEYVLNDSGARVLVVENDEQLDKVLAVRARCPGLMKIVVIEQRGLRTFRDPQVMTFEAFLEIGRAGPAAALEDLERSVLATQPGDIAFLVYTSGTTGPPKGAMISNRNVMFQLDASAALLAMQRGEKTLSFLPLCHIAERIGGMFYMLRWGNVVHFPESSATVPQDLREVAPHTIFAPPRFWEKLCSQIVLFMQEAIPVARAAYERALAGGQRVAEHRLAGRPVPASLLRQQRWLDRLVLGNVRRFLGLQNLRNALTGAAPVPPDLVQWYMALGIDLLEAFGMTETSGTVSAMPRDVVRVGFAGRPVPGVEVALGADGELLVRGPNVFCGYWNRPDQTREAIDAQGWLHTGDVAEIDDGYLGIRDRKKDILITSGGKNIAPSAIESLLKFSPYVSDAVVIGEARRYLTCLVMLDHDNVAQYAQERQVPFTDFASLATAAEVVALVRSEIESANGRLARVEQIKDFRIIDVLLAPEDEELTPTMKLKRKVVERKYAQLIDSMYGEGEA